MYWFLFTLTKAYVSVYIWIKQFIPQKSIKNSFTFVTNSNECDLAPDTCFEFCMSKLPNGKYQLLKSLPEVCDYKFLGCTVYDRNEKEYEITLQDFYVEHNILDKPVFLFLVKKQHGVLMDDDFKVAIWDHICNCVILNPSIQSIVLHKEDYLVFPNQTTSEQSS